jgi:hypothetical protein
VERSNIDTGPDFFHLLSKRSVAELVCGVSTHVTHVCREQNSVYIRFENKGRNVPQLSGMLARPTHHLILPQERVLCNQFHKQESSGRTMIEMFMLVYVQTQAQRAVFTAFLQLEFVVREVVIVGCRGCKVRSATRESKRELQGIAERRERSRANVCNSRHDRGIEWDVTKGGYPVDGLPATVYRGITATSAVGSRRAVSLEVSQL